MAEDDVKTNMTMGKHGSELFNENDTIMTHCNAGALATVAYGTALGVIRATIESGKNIKVIATETPIAGAPLTTKVRIAFATSLKSVNLTNSNLLGSLV